MPGSAIPAHWPSAPRQAHPGRALITSGAAKPARPGTAQAARTDGQPGAATAHAKWKLPPSVRHMIVFRLPADPPPDLVDLHSIPISAPKDSEAHRVGKEACPG